ncbi:TetR/AcrR family transcriptional regulator [Streptomyces sp. XD-27]|uniref:TetR/AcrR family transcriptional regulator n=1 Tax=Streptomyces sp. XD-27 TaxID=3062779 RepID=UPI0026F47E15|nr:TetR/AcrR family transcriptional regulator [Streptomyces sp. XD-27]WKX72303.1 TetR/AcrR family transcriptional regulator [Streptomyces sp. XD-27]
MARPRMFDEERAVDAALEAFWAAGYEATSTQDLCDATGLGRSSVYNTFKSKHDLFRRALARYMERRNAWLSDLLESELPLREKVRTLLYAVVDEECGEGADPWAAAGRGCLVVNTAVELSDRDPEIAEQLRRDYQVRFTALRAAFESARRDGDLVSGGDPGALAHFVIASVGGMRVSARAGAGRAELTAIADTAVAAL